MEFDAAQINEAAKELTNSDIVEFFSEKVKNHSCPTCLANDWTFLGDNTHTLGLGAFPKHGNFPLPPPHIITIALACKVCGYMRFHVAGLIGLWKLEKAARKS